MSDELEIMRVRVRAAERAKRDIEATLDDVAHELCGRDVRGPDAWLKLAGVARSLVFERDTLRRMSQDEKKLIARAERTLGKGLKPVGYLSELQALRRELSKTWKLVPADIRQRVQKESQGLRDLPDAVRLWLQALEDENAELRTRVALEVRAADLIDAKLDAVMMEYCPDEMSPAQRARWAGHQVPARQTDDGPPAART